MGGADSVDVLLLIVTALLVASVLNASVSQDLPAPIGAAVMAATAAQTETAEWALGRYETAGLALPPLIIVFAEPAPTACGGAAARVHLDETPVRIEMCWNNRFMLLHELAHVWEVRNIPASQHDAFNAMRTGVESWASLEVPWSHRGREHAANVIAWGLLEDPFPIAQTLPNDPQHLLDAYQFLTGRHPLHDGGPPIRVPDRSFFTPDRSNSHIESRQ